MRHWSRPKQLTLQVAGPKFMENREPYEIRRVMIVYNAFQTVFSFWMFKESWAFFVSGDYSWHCQPVDYSNNDQVLLSPLHWKQILKILFWPCYFCSGSPCFTSWLVVLFLKICRSSWHSILHNEEKVQPGWYDAWCPVIPSEYKSPGVCSSCDSSQHPALALLVGAQICGRWSRCVWAFPQLRWPLIQKNP